MQKLSDKLYNWASILEPNTRDQAFMTSKMPFVQPWLALMPDAHLGKGATVGSVIPTVGAIMPAACGVDVGCGMMAVQTQFTVDQLPENRSWLREQIESAIPLSAGNYNSKITATAGKRIAELEATASDRVMQNWQRQLGTLGSGNHFIEVTVDEDQRVWLFLHSGSRGVGNKLAQFHINVAKQECAGTKLPNKDLAYLTEETATFDDYIYDLRWGQRFALLNRAEMMDRVVAKFAQWVDDNVKISEQINCHHNYTEREFHFGQQVWLSRKGAIDASLGRPGLIPGSMGAASYVVLGKGNLESFNSSPHGAGRNYSRSAAKREFTMEQLEAAMEGVEWRHSAEFLDEHPLAYKDIDVVMQDAADLVEIKHELHQVVNVKGS